MADMSNKIKLNRTTLTTSRLMDFCSEKELVAQTGHQKALWPLVILKELMDNALDACEEKSITPAIDVKVSKDYIEIRDNGGGIPARTVEKVLDYTIRVSSREAYIAPDRGAQGNALKTLMMIPFVLSGEKAEGKVEITTRGVKHTIVTSVDSIRQEPVIDHKEAKTDEIVKNGTSIRLFIPRCFVEELKERFLQFADGYTFLNPHLTLSMEWLGEQTKTESIDPAWAKWRPNEPTSAHWYEIEHLVRLIGGYIAADEDNGTDRTVREMVAEFRGLSGTAKQKAVLESTGLARMNLSAMRKNNTVDMQKAAVLLAAMKEHSKPVKPSALGVIGKDNLTKKFEANGCDMKSFNYTKADGVDDEGLPFVVESAFGWFGEKAEKKRRFITGVNWSTAIINPFRELGKLGDSLETVMSDQRAGRNEPITYLLHLAYPRVQYTDRGKSALVVSGKGDDEDEEPAAARVRGTSLEPDSTSDHHGPRLAEKVAHEREEARKKDLKLLDELVPVFNEFDEVRSKVIEDLDALLEAEKLPPDPIGDKLLKMRHEAKHGDIFKVNESLNALLSGDPEKAKKKWFKSIGLDDSLGKKK